MSVALEHNLSGVKESAVYFDDDFQSRKGDVEKKGLPLQGQPEVRDPSTVTGTAKKPVQLTLRS